MGMGRADTQPYLAGFEFIQLLGRGAMGTVYLARQVSLDRLVAIKRIDSVWAQDAERVARFRREAETLARLNHPSIVAVYDLRNSDDGLHLVMEYVPGPSLHQLMQASRLSIPNSLGVIRDVSDALAHAAAHEVVHRDVKPANVLVAPSGRSKLADFGLVRLAGGGAGLTTAGQILGTPGYMSPEQASGKEADPRSDVYALAVMTYELLVGRLPFLPVPGNPMATLQAHIHGQVPHPSSVVSDFPRGVEGPLLAGLGKSPGARPPDAQRFWERLAPEAKDAWPGWDRATDLDQLAKSFAPPPVPAQEPLAPTMVLHPSVDATMVLPRTPVPPPTEGPLSVSSPESDATLLYTEAEPRSEGAAAAARVPAPAERISKPSAPPSSYRRTSAASIKLPGRPKTRAVNARSLYVAAAAVLVLVAAAVALLMQTRGPAQPTTPSLAVTAVAVSVTPTFGHCPSATYTFSATISTNGGAGNVVYQWYEPDGSTSAPTTVAVASAVSTATAKLQFTFNGSAPATASAFLQVLQPNAMTSSPAPIQYACP